MSTLHSKKIKQGIIDIILLLCLIACIDSASIFKMSKENIQNGAPFESQFYWGTSHCIIGVIFTLFIIIHIWQHWSLIKVVVKKKLYLKNKITSLVLLTFLFLIVSLSLFMVGITDKTLNFHNIFVHVFVIITIVHIISTSKKFIRLFRKV